MFWSFAPTKQNNQNDKARRTERPCRPLEIPIRIRPDSFLGSCFLFRFDFAPKPHHPLQKTCTGRVSYAPHTGFCSVYCVGGRKKNTLAKFRSPTVYIFFIWKLWTWRNPCLDHVFCYLARKRMTMLLRSQTQHRCKRPPCAPLRMFLHRVLLWECKKQYSQNGR